MARISIRPAQIRQFRERHGLTQRQLAKLLNVTPYVVSKWETGKHQPTGANALNLAKMLRLDDALHALTIADLIGALRWLDEHDESEPALECSFRELVDRGLASWQHMLEAEEEAGALDDADDELISLMELAAGVLQQCRLALCKRPEDKPSPLASARDADGSSER